MELWIHRVTKAREGQARAGHRGWARQSQVPCTGCFISMTLVERILCGAMGMWGPLVGLTKEGWACQMESGSGRLEEPPLSSAPVIKCRIREETFLPPSPAPKLSSSGPFTRLLPKNIDGVPPIHHPHS